MKKLFQAILFMSLLSSTVSQLPALTLPVTDDTFNNSKGILTPSNGKLTSLILNTNQAGLLKFDLSSLPANFNTNTITSARLKLYVFSARSPGILAVTEITSDWKESPVTNTPMPSFSTNIVGSVPSSKIQSKNFAVIDVTESVRSAMVNSASNYGFLLHDTIGQTQIATKEGPTLGPAAELEINANLSQDSVGNGFYPGSLGVVSNLFLGGLFRQGSETGTSEPAGRGIIVRRIQLTNNTVGSIVARTDTLTLERGGIALFRIVNHTNSYDCTLTATGFNPEGLFFNRFFGKHTTRDK